MTALNKPIRRVTKTALDKTYGCDSDRRVVVTLIPGNGNDVPDLIELRPERTRRSEAIALMDVYRYAMRCRINKQLLEKARAKKAAKEEAKRRRAWRREIQADIQR